MENANELESIHGVGHITADRLRQAGYDSFEKLAAASPEELNESIGINTTSAANIVQAAAEILEEAAPELPEEPEPSQEEAAPEEEPAYEESVETSTAEPVEASTTEPVEMPTVEPVETPTAEQVEVPTAEEIPTSSDPMENIVAQMANETATYALTEIAGEIAAAVRDLPDIGERFFEEVMNNPDLKTLVVSRTAERLADAIVD